MDVLDDWDVDDDEELPSPPDLLKNDVIISKRKKMQYVEVQRYKNEDPQK